MHANKNPNDIILIKRRIKTNFILQLYITLKFHISTSHPVNQPNQPTSTVLIFPGRINSALNKLAQQIESLSFSRRAQETGTKFTPFSAPLARDFSLRRPKKHAPATSARERRDLALPIPQYINQRDTLVFARTRASVR